MTSSATLCGHYLSLRSCDARPLLPASLDDLHRRLNDGFAWDPVALLATRNTTATCWSSFPTRRNPNRRSSPSSPGASPSATCSPPSSNSSNRLCPYWPWLPPPEGATQVLNVSPRNPRFDRTGVASPIGLEEESCSPTSESWRRSPNDSTTRRSTTSCRGWPPWLPRARARNGSGSGSETPPSCEPSRRGRPTGCYRRRCDSTTASSRAWTTAPSRVRHGGDLLGAITVGMPPQEPMTPATERLLVDLSAQEGLVLRNVALAEHRGCV
jgi:hypothetical protein